MPSNSLLKNTVSLLPNHDPILSPEILYVLKNCVFTTFNTRKKWYEWELRGSTGCVTLKKWPLSGLQNQGAYCFTIWVFWRVFCVLVCFLIYMVSLPLLWYLSVPYLKGCAPTYSRKCLKIPYCCNKGHLISKVNMNSINYCFKTQWSSESESFFCLMYRDCCYWQ